MAAISVTYTFVNSTTADASQVNTNFTNIIDGTSDGTKDFTVGTVTSNGAVNFKGAITLGDGSVDDLTINGSLASSLLIKTTNSYDVGSSTIALRSMYLGSSDSAAKTVRLIAGVIGTSYTLTLPVSGGTSGYFLETDGSGVTTWSPTTGPERATNYGLTATVSANALTIALKSGAGTDPASTDPVKFTYRNSTATTGTPVTRSVTAALSLVISSGSTLGHTSAQNEYIYVYAYDISGTVKLAASSTRLWDEGSLVSTTAEGGAGAADSKVLLYAATGDSNVPIRLIGRLKSNQSTAGTWATAIAEISLFPSSRNMQSRSEVWVYTANGYGAVATKIRRWTTANRNTGTAITYADSANGGGTFTINEDGLYGYSYSDAIGTSVIWGVSLNTTGTTTDFGSLSQTEQLAWTQNAAGGDAENVAGTVYLKPGDIIRAHTTGAAGGANDSLARFHIIKLSD